MLLLLKQWGDHIGSLPNFLSVLLLVSFFFDDIPLLICSCCVVAKNDSVSILIDWASFVLLLARFCFWLGCVNVLCGSWFMFCAVVARLSIFLIMRVKTWCVGKFPGHPWPQIMPACAPPCPTYLSLSLLCNIVPIRIHIHPYTPICTLHMLIKVHRMCSYSFGVFKFTYSKYSSEKYK